MTASTLHFPEAGADEGLVERAQTGDVDAFEQLYRCHIGAVFALCLRMHRHRGRAEESAQEVFVRAWQKLSLFRGNSSFSTWIHRVAVNVVLSRIRSRARWDRSETELELAGELEERVARRPGGAGVDLERAIATLPTRARLVFLLFDVHGYSHAEIGSYLGITPGGSKAQLHRARMLLREALRS